MSKLPRRFLIHNATPHRPERQLFAFIGATVISALTFLAVLELLLYATWSLAHWVRPDPLRPQISPAYAGATWVPDLYREQSSRLASKYTYVPFRVSGVTPWRGKYFNNDEHRSGVWRRTVNPESGQCPQPQTNIWIFGGSTVYGTGVPDWETLPSYLSRGINGDGRPCVVVTNFGAESYASTQELILLIEQLKRGGKPDIVIFYDGFNDASTGMAAADPWSTHFGIDTIKARSEGSFRARFDFMHRLYMVRTVDAVRQLFRRPARPLDSDVLHKRAAAVVDNYQANQNVASALAEAYHFRFYGFWQPMLLYGEKPLDSFEHQIAQFDATRKSRFDAPPVVAAYQEAERRASKASFAFMGDVFDSIPNSIYIDEAHLGPHGNEVAANAIAKYIESHPAGTKFPAPKTP